MAKVFSSIAYRLFVTLFVVVGAELVLRVIAPDPFYYWKFRFQFVSPERLCQSRRRPLDVPAQYRAARSRRLRHAFAAVRASQNLSVEFDCRMRSNNLGLLQDDDVLPGTPRRS